MEAYLDNSATTRAFDEVAELVAKVMTTEYGNASSVHHMGVISANRLAMASLKLIRRRSSLLPEALNLIICQFWEWPRPMRGVANI